MTWSRSTSVQCRLSTGVLQVTVLGRLLFFIYTCPVGEIISLPGFSYHCYGDDTQLLLTLTPMFVVNISSSAETSSHKTEPKTHPHVKILWSQISLGCNQRRSCFTSPLVICNIRRICPFLSTEATQVLVQFLVISSLDYCISVLKRWRLPTKPKVDLDLPTLKHFSHSTLHHAPTEPLALLNWTHNPTGYKKDMSALPLVLVSALKWWEKKKNFP